MSNAQRVEIELTDKEFIEFINDNHPSVNVCGFEMYQGNILYKCDRIAFYEYKNNHEDSLSRNNEQWQCSECEEIYDNEEDDEECCTKIDDDIDEYDEQY